jgi:hypothetical protein
MPAMPAMPWCHWPKESFWNLWRAHTCKHLVRYGPWCCQHHGCSKIWNSIHHFHLLFVSTKIFQWHEPQERFFFRIWELNRNDQKRLARLSKRMPKITVFCHWGFSPKTEMAGPVWAEDRTNITAPNTWRLLNWLLMTWGTCQQKCGWVLVFWALRTISCDTICLKTLKCRVRISRGFNAGTVKCGRILETHIRNSDFSRTQDFVLRETLFHFEIYEMPSCREKLIISTAVYAVFIRIDQSKCKSAALCDMTGLSIRLKVMDREITEPGRNWRCGHVACKTEASCPNRGSLCALL